MRKIYVFAEDEDGNAFYSQVDDREDIATLIATLVSQYKPFVQIESVGPINIKLKRNDQKQGE